MAACAGGGQFVGRHASLLWALHASRQHPGVAAWAGRPGLPPHPIIRRTAKAVGRKVTFAVQGRLPVFLVAPHGRAATQVVAQLKGYEQGKAAAYFI